MAVAESLGVDPVSAVVQELQQRLYERAQPLVWRATAEGLAADIAEGELLLTEFPEVGAWQLGVVFHAAPSSDAPGAAPVERGRRVLGWGCPARMQQRALELALRGVPGGPAYRDGPLVWHAIAHDGSRRMAVSSGELRISPLEGELCILTHEDGSKVELLSIGTLAELERQAFPMCLTRAGRPLRIRVRGRRVNLRSIGVPGVLGYYELKDGSLIALVLVHGDISLLQVRGAVHRVLARLSWSDLMFGEPIEVRPASRPEQGSARRCPVTSMGAVGVGTVDQPFAAEPRDVPGRAFIPEGRVANARPPRDLENGGPDGASVQDAPRVLAGEPVLTPADPRPLDVHTPMNDRHRELCRRYFRRLYRRLHGRGARKARTLVLLMLEALDRCREDITGTRLEVYACLERLLAQRLTGGPRNVRDCLDLLMCSSPFARPEPGKRCTLLFGQLHDPDSELMRFILEEDAREEHAANLPAAVTDHPAGPRAGEMLPAPPQAQQETPVENSPRPGEAAAVPSPVPVARATPSPPSNPASPPAPPWEPTLVEVYRLLGREPPTTSDSPPPPPVTTQAPKSSSLGAPIPLPSLVQSASGRPGASSMRGFTSTKTYFLGQLVDDEDESDAPSRYQGHNPLEDPFGSSPFEDLNPLCKKR